MIDMFLQPHSSQFLRSFETQNQFIWSCALTEAADVFYWFASEHCCHDDSSSDSMSHLFSFSSERCCHDDSSSDSMSHLFSFFSEHCCHDDSSSDSTSHLFSGFSLRQNILNPAHCEIKILREFFSNLIFNIVYKSSSAITATSDSSSQFLACTHNMDVFSACLSDYKTWHTRQNQCGEWLESVTICYCSWTLQQG